MLVGVALVVLLVLGGLGGCVVQASSSLLQVGLVLKVASQVAKGADASVEAGGTEASWFAKGSVLAGVGAGLSSLAVEILLYLKEVEGELVVLLLDVLLQDTELALSP